MTAQKRFFAVLAFVCVVLSGTILAGSAFAKSPQNEALLGAWHSENATAVFSKNGTVLYNGVTYQYTADKYLITLKGANGTAAFPYQLSKGALTVTANDGSLTVFTRKKPAASTKQGIREVPVRKGSGDISGKWCYMSNINASNGGRISNRCFTLNPNGTYQYYGETSSSGQYGSSASQESDQGTWTATATTLSANSARHGNRTYRLEKRNHPKTRDPMLVIEGEAYVTYYQKPSW